jgi:hypothetical protein
LLVSKRNTEVSRFWDALEMYINIDNILLLFFSWRGILWLYFMFIWINRTENNYCICNEWTTVFLMLPISMCFLVFHFLSNVNVVCDCLRVMMSDNVVCDCLRVMMSDTCCLWLFVCDDVRQRCLWLFVCDDVRHVLCCVCLLIVNPVLPVSLDCPYFIATSLFPNVYFFSQIYMYMNICIYLFILPWQHLPTNIACLIFFFYIGQL